MIYIYTFIINHSVCTPTDRVLNSKTQSVNIIQVIPSTNIKRWYDLTFYF